MPSVSSRTPIFGLLLALSSAFITPCLFAYTKNGTIYTTNGSQADVNAAIGHASPGDTVTIPQGTFTWGDGGQSVVVNKPITLQGAGTALTTIRISSGAPKWGTGTIILTSAATVRGFATVQPGTGNTTAFSAGSVNGWRITEINHTSASTAGYFCYASTYGLIDNCIITGGAGHDELIFTRGPLDSWQTPHSMGTADAVYIENCTFNGSGYVCDFNSNARGVVRFCTITGPMKVDGHGKATNTPPRGVRQTEVYNNTWTHSGNYWTSLEFRGGTGMVFANIHSNTSMPFWVLQEYYVVYNQQNASNYPIDDQIGVGMDPKRAASEPVYLWLNRKKTTIANIDTFANMAGVVEPNRDYYNEVSSFNGTSGVGSGTFAQMLAITPTRAGVGFWVTDEGDWNRLTDGKDGQLYVWNGSSWAVKYMPFTYPHPLAIDSGGQPANGGSTLPSVAIKRI